MNPLLIPWLVALPLVRDGHHDVIPRPRGFADVAATVAAEHPEVEDRVLAAELDVVAAHESAYDAAAVGDYGKSCGAWQTPCDETPMPPGWRADFEAAYALPMTTAADRRLRLRALDGAHRRRLTGLTREIRLGQARVAAKWLLFSSTRCPDFPLSLYATGRVCGPVRVADYYWSQVRAEARVPLPAGASAP